MKSLKARKGRSISPSWRKYLEENPNLTEKDLENILVLMKKGKGEWIPGKHKAEHLAQTEETLADWRMVTILDQMYGSGELSKEGKEALEKMEMNRLKHEIERMNQIAFMINESHEIETPFSGMIDAKGREELVKRFDHILTMVDRKTAHEYIQKFGRPEIKELWKLIITGDGKIPLKDALDEEKIVKSLEKKLNELEKKLKKKQLSREEFARELAELEIYPGETMRLIMKWGLGEKFGNILKQLHEHLRKREEDALSYFR